MASKLKKGDVHVFKVENVATGAVQVECRESSRAIEIAKNATRLDVLAPAGFRAVDYRSGEQIWPIHSQGALFAIEPGLF